MNNSNNIDDKPRVQIKNKVKICLKYYFLRNLIISKLLVFYKTTYGNINCKFL